MKTDEDTTLAVIGFALLLVTGAVTLTFYLMSTQPPVCGKGPKHNSSSTQTTCGNSTFNASESAPIALVEQTTARHTTINQTEAANTEPEPLMSTLSDAIT